MSRSSKSMRDGPRCGGAEEAVASDSPVTGSVTGAPLVSILGGVLELAFLPAFAFADFAERPRPWAQASLGMNSVPMPRSWATAMQRRKRRIINRLSDACMDLSTHTPGLFVRRGSTGVGGTPPHVGRVLHDSTCSLPAERKDVVPLRV